jgi:hypothetical protein
MRTLPGTSWRDAYLGVAEHLVSQAGAARLILTGTSACVDAVFHIDAGRLARLVARPAATSADDIAGGELLDRVLSRITHGRGGELLTRCLARPTGTRSAAPARRLRGPLPQWAGTASSPWPIAARNSSR